MQRINRALALSCVATAGFVITPAAGAATISGQALATPALSGSKLVLPLVLDQRSVRGNHLSTSVVTVTFSRRGKVASGRTTVPATALSWGDLVSATVKVPAAARRSQLPTLTATKMTLKGHATTAQQIVLSQQVASLSASLAKLTAYVSTLAGYTIGQFADVHAQIAGIQSTLSGLTTSLGKLQALFDALKAQVGALVIPADLTPQVNALTTQLASLTTTVGGLSTQVPALQTGLGAVTTGLTGVQATLAGITPGQLSQALTNIGALQALTSGLNVSSINSQLATLTTQLQGALTSIGTVSGGSLQSQITGLQTSLTGVSNSLTTAVGRINVVCSASANLISGPLSLIGLTHFPGC